MLGTLRQSPVSTHSRPKAAGLSDDLNTYTSLFQHTAARRRLDLPKRCAFDGVGFNTQPPEGGWPDDKPKEDDKPKVSTHSRPKAAGLSLLIA